MNCRTMMDVMTLTPWSSWFMEGWCASSGWRPVCHPVGNQLFLILSCSEDGLQSPTSWWASFWKGVCHENTKCHFFSNYRCLALFSRTNTPPTKIPETCTKYKHQIIKRKEKRLKMACESSRKRDTFPSYHGSLHFWYHQWISQKSWRNNQRKHLLPTVASHYLVYLAM